LNKLWTAEWAVTNRYACFIDLNRLSADDNSSLSKKILDISMTKVEAVIEPDCVADDIGWESVALICIHTGIVSQTELIWQYLDYSQEGAGFFKRSGGVVREGVEMRLWMIDCCRDAYSVRQSLSASAMAVSMSARWLYP
jgi:hypothetical protein